MLKKFGILALLGAQLAALSGCTNLGSHGVSHQDFNQSAKKPLDNKISRLASGETLELSVEVDGSMEVAMHAATINSFGVATLPLVGDLRVGGLRLDEAREVIAKAYGSYFVRPPVVMLNLVGEQAKGEWGHVTVTGRVSQPGRVQVKSARGIKLTAVIQEAGGFSPSARKTDIRVTRVDSKGRRLQVAVDFDAIGQKGDINADVSLFDGDIVFVPERIF